MHESRKNGELQTQQLHIWKLEPELHYESGGFDEEEVYSYILGILLSRGIDLNSVGFCGFDGEEDIRLTLNKPRLTTHVVTANDWAGSLKYYDSNMSPVYYTDTATTPCIAVYDISQFEFEDSSGPLETAPARYAISGNVQDALIGVFDLTP